MTLRVELVAPEGEVWSGNARMVIAKTADGDIGVLTGHPPVLGLLAQGSLVRILDPEDKATGGLAEEDVVAAVSSGFFSVSGDRVSVLARQAQLSWQVDAAAARAVVTAAEQQAGQPETAEVRYARALLRATGEQS